MLEDQEVYRRLHRETAVWSAALRVICQRHGLDATALRRADTGSHIVYLTRARTNPRARRREEPHDDRVIKLFAPFWRADAIAERQALQTISGLPVPEVLGVGDLEGWPYLVLRVIPGRPARELWRDLGMPDRLAVIRDLGDFMRGLHEQPTIPELATDWNAFLEQRRQRCAEHHRVDEPFRSWVAQRVDSFVEPPFDPVLLNADLTEDHLLLVERAGRWRLSGVIDFGDAKLGHPHYEFIAPFAFLTLGVPQLSHALLGAYGLDDTEEIRSRLTTYCLLHEYGTLDAMLQRHRVTDGVAFEAALWGPSADRQGV